MQHTILKLQLWDISKKELAVRKISHNKYAQIFVCVSVGYYPQKWYILTVQYSKSHLINWEEVRALVEKIVVSCKGRFAKNFFFDCNTFVSKNPCLSEGFANCSSKPSWKLYCWVGLLSWYIQLLALFVVVFVFMLRIYFAQSRPTSFLICSHTFMGASGFH